ncbi:TPA: damage-inducible protein [Acinetobacter baumannii]|uniref:DEAD/DEAH box helicase n=1 Tax=Acinetobacter baumannii TaxID=470 RepID=UPI0029724212|nr:DEAD/DEAH box helicase family protein [Acinetobacter baumannii]HAV5326545.1 damage-inducible protein [Acinetobacter baumannii]HAV5375418.1 damage-inducible protein [Acinetobacter baumannii]HAV5437366.1 damage-inducible protein [Acinetobacter baumannii]HAV5462999.1 damage-inducible protein [Acinetobacter baumannii]
MSSFFDLINTYRTTAKTEREKGTYFELLCIKYFENEPYYADLFSKVQTYSEWAKEKGLSGKDTGIDLVATTKDGDFHAIQCKLYDADRKVTKAEIDSFLAAASKTYFKRRIIVSTTHDWSDNALATLENQDPPVTKIDLDTLAQSAIDWSLFAEKKEVVFKPKKELRDHQKAALANVKAGLYEQKLERGKLIMACGTGKTFTSLKIAEACAGKGKRVLFLVPSLSLLSQTLTEWTQESTTPLHSYAVCSDTEVGKKKNATAIDAVTTLEHELQYPATTDAKKLAENVEKHHDDEHMTVVFSTYHSINTVSDAQNEHQMHEFDLIICDEAHRTTGATHDSEDDSNFVKIHDGGFILGKKRLYMTATPRIFSDDVKDKATDFTLYSMDNEKLFGETLYTINFSEAVKRGLLVDYKVIVLTVDSDTIINKIGSTITENSEIVVDDAARIVGCWKALSKQGIHSDVEEDTAPMQRALAFCQVIEQSEKARKHQVSSTRIANIFQTVVEAYQEAEAKEGNEISHRLICEAQHVDGAMGADKKEQKLNWLKATPEPQFDENGVERPICRVLSNVRCLSEGVDVPALDSVLFLTPRNSQVDVVQSVGRVMRLAPNKKRGYVILPVVIPPGVDPNKALDDNQTYKVVWQVLNALRSHDDRFDAMINKMDLTGIDRSKMEVIAITDKVAAKAKKKAAGKGGTTIGTAKKKTKKEELEDAQQSFSFESGEIERAIVAKVVQKVGNRHHWEDWANDIAKIAQTHIKLITDILARPECEKERAVFEEFAHEIRDDLNNAVSDAEIIEMLAQHLITKPVFDALFDEYSFAAHNPMAIAMQKVLDVLDQHQLDSETEALQRFYDSVKLRASGIDSAEGKQKIIVELYDKFFRNAFPRMTERLGIVYTPVEVVDFIIHSVNDVLQQEFGKSFADEGVHVLDPFTGTGTFISRLLQSGLIPPKQLTYKYKNEIHANELVLLAYYIAAINIEAVYHSEIIDEYTPFQGICLTDTFQMYEKEDLVDQVLVDNSARRKRQKELDIQVIIGNPPYSIGQTSANDDNGNISYPNLDNRIAMTYVENSISSNNKSIYDSYIRAIRWASDRIDKQGVIGFVTNSKFIYSGSADGLRKCLADEFSSLYILDLKGAIRGKAGDLAKKEGQNVFNIMTGVAISILVKNPTSKESGQIYYHNIGDYLSRDKKLELLSTYRNIGNLNSNENWDRVYPDENFDWLNQRDKTFGKFISIGNKLEKSLFNSYCYGLTTNRDIWVYGTSKKSLVAKVVPFIDFYCKCVNSGDKIIDLTNISWSRGLTKLFEKDIKLEFHPENIRSVLYRPYSKAFVYFGRDLNEYVYKLDKYYPKSNSENLLISLNGIGARKNFSTIISRSVVDLQIVDNTQCFPLYIYEEISKDKSVGSGNLFDNSLDLTVAETKYERKDGISDEGLQHFQTAYPSEQITKEDIFYYTYGLLHSEEYRTRYADNLTKELPRIPCVKKAEDFWAFSKAGRDLAHWHLNYETVEPYKATLETGSTPYNQLTDQDFYVEKMRFAKKGEKGTVIYNKRITIKDIPLEAYDYVVNGKPALEWVMERQGVSTHKDSGIVNDANDWAIETMNNPAYPLELFLRVITVSLETMKIVKALPKLDI